MKLAWPLVARRAWNSQIILQRGWDISLALVFNERNKIIEVDYAWHERILRVDLIVSRFCL
jgi:hypothetical protein